MSKKWSDEDLKKLTPIELSGLVVDSKITVNQARKALGLPLFREQIEDQPPPKPSDGPVIQDLVVEDVLERKRVGIERYGQPVLPHNGRDALVDLYQELLDAVMYTRQLIYERDHPEPKP